jgi:hypothetical protein
VALVLRQDFGGQRVLGRPKLEANLQDVVAELGAELLPPRGREIPGHSIVIAHELVFPYGRPDIVVAAVELDVWRRRRRAGIAPCTAPAALGVAINLRDLGGAATVEQLSDLAPMARVRAGIRTLVRLRWVRVRRDTVTLAEATRDSVGAMAGVEVKLNNWRRAVAQVQSWESLVDASWIAFPRNYLSHVPSGPALQRLGLIGVENSEPVIVRRARARRSGGLRVALADEFLFARWMAELDARKVRN